MIGKQISYFFTQVDESLFIKEIEKFGGILVTYKNLNVKSKEIIKYDQLWIKSSNSKIHLSNGIIERDKSEVIEYSRSLKNESQGTIEAGRLWAAMKYSNGETFVEKEIWFKNWYNSYVKWIKNYSKLSTDKGYYIGQDAYILYKAKKYVMKAGPKYFVEWK